MIAESRHVGVTIARPADEVYRYAGDPTNIPEWAPGLGTAVDRVNGEWIVRTAGGPVTVEFAAGNEFGVLDHEVRLPTGETFHNPLRAVPNGEGCDLVFTVRRRAGMTDEDFERDVAAVTADLARLKRVLEA